MQSDVHSTANDGQGPSGGLTSDPASGNTAAPTEVDAPFDAVEHIMSCVRGAVIDGRDHEDAGAMLAYIEHEIRKLGGSNYQGPKQWTAEERAQGCIGIRWVCETYVAGRPTSHDVLEYLESRGPEAMCSCDECVERLSKLRANGAEPARDGDARIAQPFASSGSNETKEGA